MIKFRKCLFYLLVLSLTLTLFLFPQKALSENFPLVHIQVHNYQNMIQVPAVVLDNEYYVYAYDFASALGGVFSFNQNDYQYLSSKLTIDETELLFKLDSKIATLNGKNFLMNGSMKIINNRIVLPLRFLEEALGLFECVHPKLGSVLISKPINKVLYYIVQPGDSLWLISQIFNTSIENIKSLNGMSDYTIYPQQSIKIKKVNISQKEISAYTNWWLYIKSAPNSSSSNVASIPQNTQVFVIGKNGDYYKISTSKGIGYVSIWALQITQDVLDNSIPSSYFSNYISLDNSKDYIDYSTYTVQKGDDPWSISVKFGIPYYELLNINKLTISSVIYVGQVLKIPIHKIGLYPNENGVEMLDWATQGDYVFPIGAVGKFIDISTGKYFYAKRTMGATHADVETLTYEDTQIMKEIFGGYWNWTRKPFILEINQRKIAVSVSGMPHAGVDGVPLNQNVDNRSGDYGYGPNLDSIKNGMDGHFDVYTFNGLRHKDYKIDPYHQLSVSIASGLK